MCIPHRNNAAAFAAWGPDQNDASTVQVAGRDVAVLAIIEAGILYRYGVAGEYRSSVSEIQAPISECGISFRWIEADVHRLLYIQIFVWVNRNIGDVSIAWVAAFQSGSSPRGSAAPTSALNFEKAISIGLKSGE
jgi:hypothetical protein